MSIPKKNRKIQICIDFCFLNIACPKDEFSLPITNVMLDNICRFERMSFMDIFLEYNKSRRVLKMRSTSFSMPLGMYHYTVMPFGLKNARGNILTRYEYNLP